jgi:quinol monooxygenase YgiN
LEQIGGYRGIRILAPQKFLERRSFLHAGVLAVDTLGQLDPDSLDVDDANAIHYEERWRSPQDIETQVRSPRYTHLLALMESASEQPSLEFHFVSETRGLEYVASARNQD